MDLRYKPRRLGLTRPTPNHAPAATTFKNPPTNVASTPQKRSSSSVAQPARRELTQAEIEADPASSAGEEEDEDESPKMKRYSETLKPYQRPVKAPRVTPRKDDSKDSVVTSGTKASLKTLPDIGFNDMEFGDPKASKKSKGYGSKDNSNSQKNKPTFSRVENFHAQPKKGINGKNGAKRAEDERSDSDAEPQSPSAHKTLLNTMDSYKSKSPSTPKSAGKAKGPAAKLHIIHDPDSLSAPVSSIDSNGVSPVRSIKLEDRGTPISDLSSPPSSAQLAADELDLEDELENNTTGNYDPPANCPMCGDPVDADELSDWQRRVGRKSMRLRDQILFCDAHKTAAARQEYSAHGYPEIDFKELPARIAHFRDDIIGILQETRPSHFRERLNGALSEGRGRTLAAVHNAKQMHGMTTGYYGPRGRRIMEEWLSTNMADAIRERAGSDKLIGFKTVSGFVQEVLVPELATWLVMEDMRQSEDGEETGEARAREILGESAAIGEIVNAIKEEEVASASMLKEIKVDDDGEDY
ncbi:RTC4-like domain-containing protein [Phyllosticta citrichinensis]|uniref:Restriction of telomere capping protein 4 n=1 Tax=Phyllosticta citrichinensis TaxID=1130410 RepID=A0ABR1XRA6_9PEZI